MRQRTHVVFDDYVTTAGNATSDARYNTLLGEFDQIGFHAVGDNATAATTVSIYVQHSSEGRQWLFRGNNSANAGTPELVLTLSGGTDSEHKMWSDACLGTSTSGPLLSFVRLFFSVAGGAAHMKVHLTQRGGAVG